MSWERLETERREWKGAERLAKIDSKIVSEVLTLKWGFFLGGRIRAVFFTHL